MFLFHFQFWTKLGWNHQIFSCDFKWGKFLKKKFRLKMVHMKFQKKIPSQYEISKKKMVKTLILHDATIIFTITWIAWAGRVTPVMGLFSQIVVPRKSKENIYFCSKAPLKGFSLRASYVHDSYAVTNQRAIFQTLWRLHCCTKFLFFELETSNFGYLHIF